jgi:hypothetical protein
LNSCVNKQNFRYWSETNPQQVHERPLHSARVTVWCAIAEFGVVGPYFFEEGGNNGYRHVRPLHGNFREHFAAPTG